MGGSPAWELCGGLTTHHRKKEACYEMLHGFYEHSKGPSGSIKSGEFLD
jgi:hypothetical protein